MTLPPTTSPSKAHGRRAVRVAHARSGSAAMRHRCPRRNDRRNRSPRFRIAARRMSPRSAPGGIAAGTLTWPEGKGPSAAVVLVSGSARRIVTTVFGHKPFLVPLPIT